MVLICEECCSKDTGWDVAQAVEHSVVMVWILLYGGSILHGGCICSLGYFPLQPVVHNWFIKSCVLCCFVCAKVHIKDPLLLIEKSSLCGCQRVSSIEMCHNDILLDVQ